jgi:hypothetical protein
MAIMFLHVTVAKDLAAIWFFRQFMNNSSASGCIEQLFYDITLDIYGSRLN